MTPKVGFKNYSPTLGDLLECGFNPFSEPMVNWWDTYVPAHKQQLIEKIIHTYYFNQTEGETPERFRWYINSQLEKIMPYYNQLYASELIRIDPLLTHKMITKERSIENLVKLANKDGSSVGHVLKDFANTNRGTGHQTVDFGNEHEEHSTSHDTTKLDRNGKEREVEESKEHEVTAYDEVTKMVTDKDVVDNTHDVLHTTENEKPGETTKTDYGKTMDKNGTGTSDTVENEDTTRHSGVAFSDTPQKKMASEIHENDPEKPNLFAPEFHNGVRLDYLTTYTDTVEVTNRDDTIGVKTSYKDHEGAGGSDLVSKGGANITDTDTDKNVDYTSKVDMTEDGTKHSDTDRQQTIDTERNRVWEDHAVGDDWHTTDSHGSIDEDTETKSVTTGFAKGREDETRTRGEKETERQQHAKDEVITHETAGYSDISASELLEAFRRTFLNIDEMIINDLRENFMEVF